MSMEVMTPEGGLQIPNGWARRPDQQLSLESDNSIANFAVTEELQNIQGYINRLEAMKASLTEYGMGKICSTNLVDVTEDNGIVLGGKEKNPSIEGTLANAISSLEGRFDVVGTKINGEKYEGIEIPNDTYATIGKIKLNKGLYYISATGWTPAGNQAVVLLGPGSWYGTQCTGVRMFNLSAILQYSAMTELELVARNLSGQTVTTSTNYNFYAIKLK